MRHRLSYANVVATLALFFALTGGAWAATSKYLMASDPITQGDLAGSTYGNPLIANGKITSSKFASTAKAPDADQLDGNDSTGFVTVVGRGMRSTAAINVSIDPGFCLASQALAPASTDPTTDYSIVQAPDTVDNRLMVYGRLAVQGGAPVLNIYTCNISPFTLELPPTTFRFTVVR
jgi:hypothetical protein